MCIVSCFYFLENKVIECVSIEHICKHKDSHQQQINSKTKFTDVYFGICIP